MLGFLDDMRIGRRIALAFLLPVFGLVAFSGFVIGERWLVAEETRSLIGVAELASDVGAVVHELQKERGASSLFLASQGTQFGDRLADQRKLTDKAALRVIDGMGSRALATLGPDFANALDKGRQAVEARGRIRGQVDTQLINSRGAMSEYSATIKTLLDLVAEIAVATPDKRTSGLATAYLSFIEAKERSGQERAVGSAGFAGGFDLALERRFLALQAQQETLLGMFERQAPPRLAQMLRDKAASAAFTDVAKMRERHAIGAGQDPITAPAWFDATTRRIDGLKEIEDAVTAELLATANAVHDGARTFLIMQVFAVVIGLGVTFLVALLVARGLTTPLVRLTGTMKRLAEGDVTIKVEDTRRPNEIGDMARAVEIFRADRIAAQRLEAEQQAEQLAKERRRLAVEALTRTFEHEAAAALAAVLQASGQLRDTAGALDLSANRMAEHTNAVANAAAITSGNVQQVAAAAEELSASIAEIGRRAAESATVSADAVHEAERTNSLVSGLAGAVNSIGEVVGLINDIASQTNLLALNATIEAARAGEAGKGFAVVANEVKGLANQTAKATEQISTQVGAVQQATRDAVSAIGGIGKTIGRISQIASAIAAAVDQQDATTRAIAQSAQQAANGTVEVSHHAADVTGEASDTGANADSVLKAAEALAQHSSGLEGSVERYLSGVAAA